MSDPLSTTVDDEIAELMAAGLLDWLNSADSRLESEQGVVAAGPIYACLQGLTEFVMTLPTGIPDGQVRGQLEGRMEEACKLFDQSELEPSVASLELVSNTTLALAKMRPDHLSYADSFLTMFDGHCCKLVDSLLASATASHAPDGGMGQNMHDRLVKGLGNLLYGYGHMQAQRPQLLEVLARRLAILSSAQALQLLGPQGMTAVLFAAGRTNSAAGTALVDLLLPTDRTSVDLFRPLDLSTIVYALARMQYRRKGSRPFLGHVVASITDRIRICCPQVISNMVYACAKLQFDCTALVRATSQALQKRTLSLTGFKPQEMANLAWGLSLMNIREYFVCESLADHIPPLVHLFKPQELSITLYAFAVLGFHGGQSKSGSTGHVSGVGGHASGASVSAGGATTISSTGAAGAPVPSGPRTASGKPIERYEHLGQCVAKAVAERIEQCSPQAISNTIYALGRMGIVSPQLFNTACRFLPGIMHKLAPQHISNITHALARLGWNDPAFLQAVCEFVPSKLADFKPQNIANTVYAMGKLRYRNDFFLSAVAAHMPLRLKECVSQDVSNVVYTFGVLGMSKPVFFEEARNFVWHHLLPRIGPKDKEYLVSAFSLVGFPLESTGGSVRLGDMANRQGSSGVAGSVGHTAGAAASASSGMGTYQHGPPRNYQGRYEGHRPFVPPLGGSSLGSGGSGLGSLCGTSSFSPSSASEAFRSQLQRSTGTCQGSAWSSVSHSPAETAGPFQPEGLGPGSYQVQTGPLANTSSLATTTGSLPPSQWSSSIAGLLDTSFVASTTAGTPAIPSALAGWEASRQVSAEGASLSGRTSEAGHASVHSEDKEADRSCYSVPEPDPPLRTKTSSAKHVSQ